MKSSEIDSIYEKSGFNGLQYRLLELTEGSYRKAVLYGYLGDEEKAMDWLEKGVNEKKFSPEFTFQYQFRNLHSIPRFQSLLRQIGLSDIGTVD